MGKHHNTIEGFTKFNESTNYLSDDLPKNKHHAAAKYQSLQQDESYLDASVYEQFIQGPHNISQFTSVGGSKVLDDMNSYSQYIQRPQS